MALICHTWYTLLNSTCGLKFWRKSNIVTRSFFQNASMVWAQLKSSFSSTFCCKSCPRMAWSWISGCMEDSKQTSIRWARFETFANFSISSLSFWGLLEMASQWNCFQQVFITVKTGQIGDIKIMKKFSIDFLEILSSQNACCADSKT